MPAKTLADLRARVLRRLGEGEASATIWTDAEVDTHLKAGYRALATALIVFWDQTYLENLPRGFSFTAVYEAAYAAFNYGRANYTLDDERRLFDPEDAASGFGNHTSPFEATDGFLEAAGASTDIPATAELDRSLTEIERATYDARTIDAFLPHEIAVRDSRYLETEGEVYGYLWRQEGHRTFRQVRKPSAQGTTYTITGSWGLLRTPADLSAATVTGTWGVPSLIPGQHPLGPDVWGIPRRPYSDGLNVRIEHGRYGRDLVDDVTECELPERYAVALGDYAQWKCLDRPGPGHDHDLAQWYASRWARMVARITKRVQGVVKERIGVFGASAARVSSGPPRPRLPYNYGSRVR